MGYKSTSLSRSGDFGYSSLQNKDPRTILHHPMTLIGRFFSWGLGSFQQAPVVDLIYFDSGISLGFRILYVEAPSLVEYSSSVRSRVLMFILYTHFILGIACLGFPFTSLPFP